MTIADCARIVERGDPRRFMAAMAAPVPARRVLFPLYAFNLELARAAWASAESMIVAMRLQWWRDALEDPGSAPVRTHEVMGPLGEVIEETGLPVSVLDAMAEARLSDVERRPFGDMAALEAYLDATAGGLMWLSARALGAPDRAEVAVRAYGRAAGMASYLGAVADLVARGREPLPGAGDAAGLARTALGWLSDARAARGTVARDVAPALLQGWQAEPLLRLAVRRPGFVAEGRLQLSEFRARAGLLWQAAGGRW